MPATDIGTSLTLQVTKRFPNLHPAGYRTIAPISSPLMVDSDGYVRWIAGIGEEVETYLAAIRKDFSFIGPNDKATNRRARAPHSLTLNPLTLETVLTTSTPITNASAGGYSPQSTSTRLVRWGNRVRVGQFCVIEKGRTIIASYGGDINGCFCYDKFTGERVEFSTSPTGSNWGGELELLPDGTIRNLGPDDHYQGPRPFLPIANTDVASYSVYADLAGYKINRIDTERRTSMQLHVPLGTNPGAITDVKTANGLLFIQSVVGMDVIISVVKGDKTKTLTLPSLPTTGYVPAPITNMTLGEGVEIKPLKIAQPDPNAIDTQAVDPKFRHAYLFPVVDGPAFVRVIHAYMDQHGVDPSDCRLWLFPTTWPEPSTRKNIPKPIGVPIARRNVGKVGSGLYRIDFDVTVEMEVARLVGQPQIAFCLEGVAPPNYAASKVYLIDQTRLIAGSASPLPPSPVPTPLLDVTIPALNYDSKVVGVDGRSWGDNAETGVLRSLPADGMNFGTEANALANAPVAKYSTPPLPDGKFNISIVGIGFSQTMDSCFVSIDGAPLQKVDSFTAQGTTRLVGTFILAPGIHTIRIYPRESGFGFAGVLVKQIS